MLTRSGTPDADREEERAERNRLDQLDSKIRELRPKREAMIRELFRLSDEQRAMYDQRAPVQSRLEELNEVHRQLGRELSRTRNGLDTARRIRDERLAVVRELRAALPKTARSRLDLLRREIEKLEMEQQTRAVPLEEENALIDRMRQLRKEIAAAESEAATILQHREALRVAEEAFEAARVEVERLRAQLDGQRVERDRAMGALKDALVAAGRQMALLREKAQARGVVRRELDDIDRTLHGLEREFNDLRHRHQARRGDARRLVVEHNRSARRAVSDPSALDRAVDDRLERLLKDGKIRLT
jgi:uncharacterized coiled-coil DUF342 family protein